MKIRVFSFLLLCILIAPFTSIAQSFCNGSDSYQRGYRGGWNDSKLLINLIFTLDPQTGVRCNNGGSASPSISIKDSSDSLEPDMSCFESPTKTKELTGSSISTFGCKYSFFNAMNDVLNNQEVRYRLYVLSISAQQGNCYAAGAHDGLLNGLRESSHYPKKSQ